MARQLVFVVPGFFGFEKLGPFEYFVHVEAALQRHLPDDWEVIRVPTPPTASLPERARVLLDTIEGHADDQDTIHLVGHSSGGLDIRLVATPAARFDPRAPIIAQRVKTIVTVATPHRGTPLASAFDGIMGKGLVAVTSRAAAGGMRAVARTGPLVDYLSMIGEDQGLLTQLTPDALDLFNATTPDAPGVRYGSVVAMTPGRPHLPLYRALRTLSARMPQNRETAIPSSAVAALERHAGRTPTRRDSDGIVPTRSQIWGQVVHVAASDHLDVLGHFDWLRSGASFGDVQLDALWRDVARFLRDEDRSVAETKTRRRWPRRPALFATAVLLAFVIARPLTHSVGLGGVRLAEIVCFALLAAGAAYAVDRFAR